jgi:hypothetical protein
LGVLKRGRSRIFAKTLKNPEQKHAPNQSNTSTTTMKKQSNIHRLREKCLALLGPKCNWPGCTWTDPRALQIDHIHGLGGLKREPSYYTYLDILKMDNPHRKYQVLCANHNWVKRYENNEVPLFSQTPRVCGSDFLDWSPEIGGKPKDTMVLCKCLNCDQIFEENGNGIADNGIARPMCPKCFEEIDIESVGEYDGDLGALSDGTGHPY